MGRARAGVRRIFLDTEFKNLPWSGHSDLLWIGLADEEGRWRSAINADAEIDEHASEFTKTVVVPRMTADEPCLDRSQLDAAIRAFYVASSIPRQPADQLRLAI